jgi:hypothetical protein
VIRFDRKNLEMLKSIEQMTGRLPHGTMSTRIISRKQRKALLDVSRYVSLVDRMKRLRRRIVWFGQEGLERMEERVDMRESRRVS